MGDCAVADMRRYGVFCAGGNGKAGSEVDDGSLELLGKGISLFFQARLHEAQKAFHDALKAKPALLSARFWQGQCFAACGAHDDVIRVYRPLLDEVPDWSLVAYYLGVALAQTGRHQEAVTCLRRMIEHTHADEFLYCALANAHVMCGELMHAVEVCHHGVQRFPDSSLLRERLDAFNVESAPDKGYP